MPGDANYVSSQSQASQSDQWPAVVVETDQDLTVEGVDDQGSNSGSATDQGSEGVVSKETVESLYGGQFTLSTPLIKPNFCDQGSVSGHGSGQQSSDSSGSGHGGNDPGTC